MELPHSSDLVDCVVLILLRDDQVLVEKRKPTKRVLPGAVALPGGHVEAGEQPEMALLRETREELAIVPLTSVFVCTLLHRSQEFRRLHYFAVSEWSGDISSSEAESVAWLPLLDFYRLDLEVDRMAISEYLRHYRR